ncbi:hypothetical protein [Crossiella sp. CA198]|uniref:hypothetical protein n=1 Tax=Crossiella sp. CA198 TaxID=3455607 RepID=UPI003F8D3746
MTTSDQTPATPDKRADLAGRVRRLVHRHFPYCDHNQVNTLAGQVWTEVQVTLDQMLPAPAADEDQEQREAETASDWGGSTYSTYSDPAVRAAITAHCREVNRG